MVGSILTLSNGGKELLTGQLGTCVGSSRIFLNEVFLASNNDTDFGVCRNCGVRPADKVGGKCGICLARGY